MKTSFDEPHVERDGERAARADRPWHSNPFLQRENMPVATGETLGSGRANTMPGDEASKAAAVERRRGDGINAEAGSVPTIKPAADSS